MTGFWDKHSEAVFGYYLLIANSLPEISALLQRARRQVFKAKPRRKSTVSAVTMLTVEESLPKDAPTIVRDPVEFLDVCEPIFPVELEQVIFETTALMHPTAIPALLRVARRVLVWSMFSASDAFNTV
jgi:hypothetical protein